MAEEKKIKVSFFESYKTKKSSKEVDLQTHLLTSHWEEQVNAIRREPDKEKRDEMKMMLPAITPSGIFKRRCSSGIISYSGLICIDIDSKQNPCINDWEALKSTITHLPGLWYAGLSASGNGLFVLFRVKYPERHKEHFAALSMDMRNLGIVIDESGKDICRLRGVSFDENPVLKPEAIPREIKTPKTPNGDNVKEAHVGACGRTRPNLNNLNNLMAEPREQTARNARKLVEKIQNSGTDITDYYKDWFSIGCSLASEFGESGRNWYHIISSQSLKYKQDECDRQYDKCLRCCSRTSIRTFFYFCKQFGILLEQNLKQTLSKTQNNPDNPLGFLETPKKPLKNP